MKPTIVSIISMIVFTSVLMVFNAQAGEPCSNATLKGRYGFLQQNAFILERGLVVSAGTKTYDGKGNVSGVWTAVFQDTGVQHFAIKGTYTVNPDCTASEALGTATQDMVVVEGGKEILYIATRSDRVATHISKKQDLPECTEATLEGRYGLILNGTIFERGRVAAVGVLTFDGSGNVSYAATAAFEDTGLQHPMLQGTYTVNPDCTGSSDLGGGATFDFAIVGDGREILQIATRPDRAVSWVIKKQ